MSQSPSFKENAGGWLTLLWGLLGGAFLFVYLPVLTGLVRAWGNSDDYSHGFFIIPISVYFLWQKRTALGEAEVRGAWPGVTLAVVSLFACVVARKAEMQTLSSLSMIFFLWGSVIYLFGYRVFRLCLFPLFILFFMVPVPSQVIAALTIPLQLTVTNVSVGLAAALGIPVYSEGNVIHLPEGTFEVVQACSGLRSLMALLTLGAVLSYWTLRSNLLRITLFLLAVPIAVAVNIVRVFLLVAVFGVMRIDLSEGAPHTALGLGVFVVALGLFMLCGKGLAICER